MVERNESNEIAVSNKQTDLMQASQENINGIIQRVNMINHLRDNLMTEDVHYGTIPGVKKKMLFKPGIDVLCLAFEFAIDVEIEYEAMEGGHREYTGVGTVTHIPTGKVLGNGTGLCTTMESKYRWRFDYTDGAVPKKYWESKDPLTLGGPNFVAKKNFDDKWIIAIKNENPDIADQYNTCIKMCEKRVRSACIQNVTACSSIFEQEDIKIEPVVANAVQEKDEQNIISGEQVAALIVTIEKLNANKDKFLKDYLISDLIELEKPNFNVAMADIKAGKYSPKPKAKGF